MNWHWSGKHHRVVKGINLSTLLWTDKDKHIPLDSGFGTGGAFAALGELSTLSAGDFVIQA